MIKRKARKVKLTGVLLHQNFTKCIQLKCFRQHIIWPVMSTLAKISVFLNPKWNNPQKWMELHFRVGLSRWHTVQKSHTWWAIGVPMLVYAGKLGQMSWQQRCLAVGTETFPPVKITPNPCWSSARDISAKHLHLRRWFGGDFFHFFFLILTNLPGWSSSDPCEILQFSCTWAKIQGGSSVT